LQKVVVTILKQVSFLSPPAQRKHKQGTPSTGPPNGKKTRNLTPSLEISKGVRDVDPSKQVSGGREGLVFGRNEAVGTQSGQSVRGRNIGGEKGRCDTGHWTGQGFEKHGRNGNGKVGKPKGGRN